MSRWTVVMVTVRSRTLFTAARAAATPAAVLLFAVSAAMYFARAKSSAAFLADADEWFAGLLFAFSVAWYRALANSMARCRAATALADAWSTALRMVRTCLGVILYFWDSCSIMARERSPPDASIRVRILFGVVLYCLASERIWDCT